MNGIQTEALQQIAAARQDQQRVNAERAEAAERDRAEQRAAAQREAARAEAARPSVDFGPTAEQRITAARNAFVLADQSKAAETLVAAQTAYVAALVALAAVDNVAAGPRYGLQRALPAMASVSKLAIPRPVGDPGRNSSEFYMHYGAIERAVRQATDEYSARLSTAGIA